MLTIQSLDEAVTPSSCVSRGRAVYSTVMSTTISNRALETMASTSQRPGAGAATAGKGLRCVMHLLL